MHIAADAFWNYWRENGETHKHGYYESTWGAINAAIASAGIVQSGEGLPSMNESLTGEFSGNIAQSVEKQRGINSAASFPPPEAAAVLEAAEAWRKRAGDYGLLAIESSRVLRGAVDAYLATTRPKTYRPVELEPGTLFEFVLDDGGRSGPSRMLRM